LKNVRNAMLMKCGPTPAVLSDLRRLQSSRPQPRPHIFGANYGEVMAWKQTSNRPVLQTLKNWGKDSVASIASRPHGNVNRSPRKRTGRHIGKVITINKSTYSDFERLLKVRREMKFL
jgi:hypothetical protein